MDDLLSTCREREDLSVLPESDDESDAPGATDFRATAFEPWPSTTTDWRRADARARCTAGGEAFVTMGYHARRGARPGQTTAVAASAQPARPDQRPGQRPPLPSTATVRRECTNLARLFRTTGGELAMPFNKRSVKATQLLGGSMSKLAARLARKCAAKGKPRSSAAKFHRALSRAVSTLALPQHVLERIQARLEPPSTPSPA